MIGSSREEFKAHKTLTTLSGQISNCIHASLGFEITVHQFRHLAAAIILKEQPGNFELVRQVLGHKTVQTTIDFYACLETTHATRIFGNMVESQIKSSLYREELT
jgi:integrase